MRGPSCEVCGGRAVIGLDRCTKHMHGLSNPPGHSRGPVVGTEQNPLEPVLVMPSPKPRDRGITHDVDFMFAAFCQDHPGKWVKYPAQQRFAGWSPPLEAKHVARRLKRVRKQMHSATCAYRAGGYATRMPNHLTLLTRWDRP